MKVLHIPTATEYEFRTTSLGGFYDRSELDWIFIKQSRDRICFWSARLSSSDDCSDPVYSRRYTFMEMAE